MGYKVQRNRGWEYTTWSVDFRDGTGLILGFNHNEGDSEQPVTDLSEWSDLSSRDVLAIRAGSRVYHSPDEWRMSWMTEEGIRNVIETDRSARSGVLVPIEVEAQWHDIRRKALWRLLEPVVSRNGLPERERFEAHLELVSPSDRIVLSHIPWRNRRAYDYFSTRSVLPLWGETSPHLWFYVPARRGLVTQRKALARRYLGIF